MEFAKKKILIIENELKYFTEITEKINSTIGNCVEVFPQHDQNQNTILNFNFLVEEYIEMLKFDEILEEYKDIDLFIIDVFLKEEKQQNGFQLEKKINSKYRDNPVPVIMISNAKYTRKNYIWKGESDYTIKIVDNILKEFPEIKNHLSLIKKPAKSKINSIKVIQENLQLYGYYNTLKKGINWFEEQWKRLINLCIISVFYCLIMITTFYSAHMVFREFFPKEEVKAANMEKEKSNLQKTSNAFKDDGETLILEHSERIFLYLLPIFIVFGFFIYYKTNTSIYFFNGIIQAEDQENSTQSMNFTKIIFISSIISYTLIKVIDKIFFKKDASLLTLISAGVLLMVLMGYFILINHHKTLTNHSEITEK